MSYEKVKIINPEAVRNPETSYVYVGYGTYNEFTGMWIKEANGTISIISGGTGGGGTNYWAKAGSDLSTGTAFGITDFVKIEGAKLFIDPTGLGTSSSPQALTVNGSIKLGTTSLGDYAGSIKFTGTDFFGYVTGRGWLSLTQSGGTSGTAGTSYWTPILDGIAPDSFDKIYVGSGGFSSTSGEPINSSQGITLGIKTSKPNKEGSIYYSTQGYFYGVSGTSLTDRRLDTWNVNINGYAYYNDTVVVGRITTAAETLGSHTPKLNISGYTISDHIVSRYFAPAGAANPGGFGGFSGSTLKYGITKSISITDLGSIGAAPWGGGPVPTQMRKGIDIVNGLITNFEITDGGAPANMTLRDYGLDGDAYSKSETDSLYSPKSGVFNVDTADKTTSDGEFIVATNQDFTIDHTVDNVTGKTFFIINTKAGSINVSARNSGDLSNKTAAIAQGKMGICAFNGNSWSLAEIAYSAKTFTTT